jgi:hypothetical protein
MLSAQENLVRTEAPRATARLAAGEVIRTLGGAGANTEIPTPE